MKIKQQLTTHALHWRLVLLTMIVLTYITLSVSLGKSFPQTITNFLTGSVTLDFQKQSIASYTLGEIILTISLIPLSILLIRKKNTYQKNNLSKQKRIVSIVEDIPPILGQWKNKKEISLEDEYYYIQNELAVLRTKPGTEKKVIKIKNKIYQKNIPNYHHKHELCKLLSEIKKKKQSKIIFEKTKKDQKIQQQLQKIETELDASLKDKEIIKTIDIQNLKKRRERLNHCEKKNYYPSSQQNKQKTIILEQPKNKRKLQQELKIIEQELENIERNFPKKILVIREI